MALEEEDGRIVRRKLSDQVLDRLRRMMEDGELVPGDAMPSERDLMARFGVGRPAVREALQTLSQMGLITITHGGRSRVNALSADSVLRQADEVARLFVAASPDNLEHLKQARRMFEIGMVEAGVARATDADVAELRTILDRQRAALNEDLRAFVRADMDFHGRIARLPGNPLFAALSDAMLALLFRHHSQLLHWSGRETVTLAEHAQILDRIAARDTAGASAAMRAHLDRSNTLYQHHP